MPQIPRAPASIPRRITPLLAALALAACGGGGGSGGAAPTNGANGAGGAPTMTILSSQVSGRVTLDDGTPIAGATVTAYQTNDHSSLTATTDANGRYTIAGLLAASQIDYEISVDKSGYGYYPTPSAGPGVSVHRADDNGLYHAVLGLHAPSTGGVTGLDFTAYDGSRPRVTALAAATLPSARFDDHADGTVTDRWTGLVWLKDAGCLGTANWPSAVAAARQLASGACGLADGSAAGQWRLPNIVELESLVDTTRSHPALPAAQPFTSVAADYWSSTTYYGDITEAWVLRMTDGRYLNDATSNVKATSIRGVWAVRDGSAPGAVALQATGQYKSYADGDDGALQRGVALTAPRFIDRGNGTVVDTMTGLMWLKKADCIANQSWSASQTAIAQLADGQCGLADGSGAGAWRLPTRAEMLSLADRTLGNHADEFDATFLRTDGSVKRGAVFGSMATAVYYWTASADAADTNAAWSIYSCDFGVYDVPKTDLGYALAVR